MKVHFLASTFHLKAEAKLETDSVMLSKSPAKPTGVEAQERNQRRDGVVEKEKFLLGWGVVPAVPALGRPRQM